MSSANGALFAENFVWGAAAASYQIEGATEDDGRGPSVWDMLCQKPGAVWQGHTGDVACNHYHLYRDDVQIMKTIGLHAYRLSISWPRVLPGGVGSLNEKGIAFYDALVDSLLEAGITPYVTLFHWDFPYALYCKGGWLNPDSSQWFADYTRVMVDCLSDRVQHWMTLNEPQCFIGLGHRDGIHAPGDKLGWREVLRAGHNALLAHGRAVQVIRQYAKTPPQIGYAPVGVVAMPRRPEDVELARAATFSVYDKNLWNNTWFSDPIFFRQYPEDGLRMFGADAPYVASQDMEIIGQPLDFYGVNIYQGIYVEVNDAGKPDMVPWQTGYPQTAMDWYVTPDCLYWGPKFMYERYGLPIYITENGMAGLDWVARDGRVYDHQRIDYLARHLMALGRAQAEGVDVRGYFQWSIMDNFEWAEGYRKRFGLVHVDYTTQVRTLKESAHWYRDVITSNGANLLA